MSFFIPWELILLVALGGLVLVTVLVVMIRRRGSSRANPAEQERIEKMLGE